MRERRREGRSKTFDWAEFRPIAQALAQERVRQADGVQAEPGDLERSRRREERRKRYESVTGAPPEPGPADTTRMELESAGSTGDLVTPLLERQQKMQDEIEQRWQQVEQTPFREERRVPLSTSSRDNAELEKLLESYKKGVSGVTRVRDRGGWAHIHASVVMCVILLPDSVLLVFGGR